MSDLLPHSRPDLNELPALLAEPTAGMRPPTEAPAVAESGAHICTPRADWDGRCWCQPRSLMTVMLHRSLAATERKGNVVVLSEWRGR